MAQLDENKLHEFVGKMPRLADRVQKTSDIMMADLEEWQTVFRTRPLSLPA